MYRVIKPHTNVSSFPFGIVLNYDRRFKLIPLHWVTKSLKSGDDDGGGFK